jgi:hypothetical protein
MRRRLHLALMTSVLLFGAPCFAFERGGAPEPGASRVGKAPWSAEARRDWAARLDQAPRFEGAASRRAQRVEARETPRVDQSLRKFLGDDTLQKGDVIVTEGGLRVYAGGAQSLHSPGSFVALDGARAPSAQLSEMRRAAALAPR